MTVPPHPAPTPTDVLRDPARVEALRRCGLAAAAEDATCERAARLALRLMGGSVSLVTAVGAEESFIRGAAGDDAYRPVDRVEQTVDTLCRHVVVTGEPFVVADVREDPRTRDLTFRSPVAAYLGVPFRGAAGRVLGALCVTEVRPRAWSEADRATLTDLAALLGAEMARREAVHRTVDARTETGTVLALSAGSLDAIDDLFFVLDTAGRLVRWNRRVGEVTGWSDEELGAMSALAFFDEASRGAVARAIERVFEGGQARVEATVVTKTGASSPYEFNGRIVRADDGRVLGICGTARDISDRRRTERLLRENAEQLSLALGVARMGTWTTELRTGATTCSPETFEIFGVDTDSSEVPADRLVELVHPADRPRMDAAAEVLFAQGMLDLEYRVVRPDGSVRWLHSKGRYIPGAPDRAACIVGAVVDVTERKRTIEALRHSRRRFKRLVNGVEGILWEGTVDRETQHVSYTFVSARLRDALGYEPETWVADAGRWVEAIAPEDRHMVVEACTQATLRGADHTLEYRMRRADGSVCWVRDFVSILGETDGHLIVGGLMIDVTDRKAHEQALVEAKERAEAAVRLKESFLTNMSHEIRTPLSGLIALADVLADEVPEAQRELAGMVRQSGRRLHETMNAVLQLAQLQSGAVELFPEPADLRAVVRDAAERFAPDAVGKGLALDVEAPSSPVVARVDRHAVQRVLSLLLSNAVKFTDRGRVTVSVSSRGGAVELAVSDTGVGISPSFMPDLFVAFRQESEGLARTHEGIGLGLAVADALVAAMHGTIDVESEKGGGSTFRVRLPA